MAGLVQASTRLLLRRERGPHEGVALRIGEARKGLGARVLPDVLQQGEARMGVGREVKPPAAPVAGVLAALDEPAGLQLVEDPHERDGLDL